MGKEWVISSESDAESPVSGPSLSDESRVPNPSLEAAYRRRELVERIEALLFASESETVAGDSKDLSERWQWRGAIPIQNDENLGQNDEKAKLASVDQEETLLPEQIRSGDGLCMPMDCAFGGFELGSIAAVDYAAQHGSFSQFITAYEWACGVHGSSFRLPDDILFKVAMQKNEKIFFSELKDAPYTESQGLKIARFIVCMCTNGKAAVHHCDPESKQTPLFHALLQGSLFVSTFLIASKANVDHMDADGETPLFNAARSSRANCVEVLLDFKASPTHTNKKRRMPLYYACQVLEPSVWDEKLITVLLNNMSEEHVNHGDARGQTALFVTRDGKIGSMLMEKKADPNIRDSEGGRTALCFAARSGHVSQVKALIQGKADANSADDMQQTALFYATAYCDGENQLAVCKLLVEDGHCNALRLDQNGVSVFDIVKSLEGTLHIDLVAYFESLLAKMHFESGELEHPDVDVNTLEYRKDKDDHGQHPELDDWLLQRMSWEGMQTQAEVGTEAKSKRRKTIETTAALPSSSASKDGHHSQDNPEGSIS